LARHDRDDWVFEQPFSADADDKAVNDALRAMGRLRATEWLDSDASASAGRFGLSPPAVHVEVECEVRTPVESEDEGADEAETGDEDESEPAEPAESPAEKVEVHRYALDVASHGPLGKDSTVYAKPAEGNGVCTIQKYNADKLTPTITTWRNMKVCPAKVSGATRIELDSEGESAVMVRNDPDEWVFESDGGKAEAPVINELLDKIDALEALNFVDDVDPTDVEYGFDPPQARIVLTVPGHDEPIRLLVGHATDQVTKRLYYVRRDESRRTRTC